MPVLSPVVTCPACRYLLCSPTWQPVCMYYAIVTSVRLSSWINEGDYYYYYLLYYVMLLLTLENRAVGE